MTDLGDSEVGKVLAIASHVVSGYVGNTTTTFVLNLLGLETGTLNTVQYSNHSGYRQLRGFRTSAAQILEIFEGLEQSGLLEGFDMLLTGYVPGEEELLAVGKIAREVKARGGGFWLLDPVMGDQGRLYVSEGVLPVYKSLMHDADLIVPNQFETELVSGVEITSLATLSTALDELHRIYTVPHIVITSVTFTNGATKMVCAGSSITSTGAGRKFVVDVPIIDGFFSGTGDLFAALTLARLREHSAAAGLLGVGSWIPPDETATLDLPLTKAVEVVLGSIHLVLKKTKRTRDRILDAQGLEPGEKERHVQVTRASELRLVQSQEELLRPNLKYSATVLP